MTTIRLVAATTAACVALTLGGAVTPASAQESPETAPEETAPEETGVATPPPEPAEVTASATATYSFGAQPLQDVFAAAQGYSRPTGCSLTNGGLAALMVAPTFPETGATGSGAPSPMTLSRWDRDRALYSLADPSTDPRAFWHPGIGMWQFDSAGLWGRTAYERMDASEIAPLAASEMGRRYCNASGTDESKRAAAWGPWVACRSGSCEKIFWDIYAGSSSPPDVETDSSVSRDGGVTTRPCAPPGLSARTCYHVDPDDAEGYGGWRGTPGGSDKLAPLSLPFDVTKAGGDEWRLWRSADTGYGVEIAAKKPLGTNARLEPNPDRPCELVSPITWYVDGNPVDSVDRRLCAGAVPPTNFSLDLLRISGTYETIVGDFDGDDREDIFWYAPGGAPDYLWDSPVGDSSSIEVTVNGTYEPLVGDFDDDGRDDIFWYAPGPAPDYLWTGEKSGAPFRNRGSSGFQVNGDYEPIVGDHDGDGDDDILWFSERTYSNYLWLAGPGMSFSSRSMPLALDAVDAVGDFDGDGRTDLVGHRPGSAPDSFYYATGNGYVRRDMSVNGSYSLVVGDFDDNGADDIHWYSTGPGSDYLWFHEPDRPSPGQQPVGAPADLGHGRTPIVLDTPGGAEIVWVGPGNASDQYWRFSGRSLQRSGDLEVTAPFEFLVGRWTSAREGVLFYRPGGATDVLWSR
ncbi:MAG: VCBS repeat-containing protein [Acidimicrobiales bacterium]|nr:VCBS repeat-containing protein [Acidimicrobiales bacterium]